MLNWHNIKKKQILNLIDIHNNRVEITLCAILFSVLHYYSKYYTIVFSHIVTFLCTTSMDIYIDYGIFRLVFRSLYSYLNEWVNEICKLWLNSMLLYRIYNYSFLELLPKIKRLTKLPFLSIKLFSNFDFGTII